MSEMAIAQGEGKNGCLHDAVIFLKTMVLLLVVRPRSMSRILLNGNDTTEVLLIFAMISPIITCS